MQQVTETERRGQGEQDKVKVMVRVRPFLPRELQGIQPNEYPLAIVHIEGNNVTCDGRTFDFHEAFWSLPESQKQVCNKAVAAQEDVYRVVGAPAVAHAIKGYHSCIFAYGQTGSGKTYSMLGDPADPGIAPRLVEELFDELDAMRKDRRRLGGFQHHVEISFMEIYNERVRDLFQGHTDEGSGSGGGARRRASVQAGGRRMSRRPSAVVIPGSAQQEALPVQPLAVGPLPAGDSTQVGRGFVLGDTAGTTEGAPSAFSWVELPAGARDDTAQKPKESPATPKGSKKVSYQVLKDSHNSGRPPSPRLLRRGSAAAGSMRRRSLAADGAAFASGGRRGSVLPLPDVEEEKYAELKVRQSPQTGTFVEGLRCLGPNEGVRTAEDVKRHMRFGMEHRATAETRMNATSSRSHAIFQLRVLSRNQSTGVHRYAHINIVDLAGSERLKMSHSEGERLVEATRINLSLSTLRRVIDTLVDNSLRKKTQPKAVVPYRDSMLTWILSESLGGNSRTVMLATVSPAESNREDTLNTLKYAHKAKDIVNTVYVNEQKTSVVLSAMQKELELLRSRLHEEEQSGEHQYLQSLRDELQAKEANFRIAMQDNDRLEQEYRAMEEDLRMQEESLALHKSTVEELRRQGVEEMHRDETDAFLTHADRLASAQTELEEKLTQMKHTEEVVQKERTRAVELRAKGREVQERKEAFRRERESQEKSHMLQLFRKAFTKEKLSVDKERVQTDLRATTDRVSQLQVESARVSREINELRGLCQLLGQKVPQLKRHAEQREALGAEQEGRCREELRSGQARYQQLLDDSAEAYQQQRRVSAELCQAQEQAEKQGQLVAHDLTNAELRVSSAQRERTGKGALLRQLRTQLAVILGEVAEMRKRTDSLSASLAETCAQTSELSAACEVERQMRERLHTELAVYEAAAASGWSCVEDLGKRSLGHLTACEQKRRAHLDLREFVSHRFFPAGSATAAQVSAPASSRAALTGSSAAARYAPLRSARGREPDSVRTPPRSRSCTPHRGSPPRRASPGRSRHSRTAAAALDSA
eukprot:TRINITY_DN32352_c1_g1_i1.p1 TRINITY_DN32352_c1_g1~~TRINITY_DN32352_c1_g1_i1.p1  ORF type:complete len:1045 (+),score=262.64 TRINITY_DN32352_c1_g1_i1:88-3222(+)